MLPRLSLALVAGLVLSGSVVLDELAPPVAAGSGGLFAHRVIAVHHEPDLEGDPLLLVVAAPTWGDAEGRLWTVEMPADEGWELTDGEILVDGTEANQRLGRSLAAGDFNDDGLTDLVVGGYGGISAGRLFVMWGKASGWHDPLLFRSSTAWRVDGASLSVADLDGDGVDDLVAGTTEYPDFRSHLLLYYGDSGLGPTHMDPWTADPDAVFHDHEELGGTVEAGVDWNCDGHPDLASSGPDGSMWVIFNPTDAGPVAWKGGDHDVGAMLASERIELPGLHSSTASVHWLGEVTDDECTDVLVVTETLQGGRGEVLVIEGRSTDDWQLLGDAPPISDVARFRRRGAFPFERLGASAAPVWWSQPLDPNGESIRKPDLLLGAPLGVAANLQGDVPGRVLLVPAGPLWDEADWAVPEDGPGVEPEDQPSLHSLAWPVLETLGDEAGLGTALLPIEDLFDADAAPEVLAVAPGWRLDEDEPEVNGAVFLVQSEQLGDSDGDGTLHVFDCDDEDASFHPGQGDCDDLDPRRHPGAPPLSADLDTDCDGEPDWPGGWTCDLAPASASGLTVLALAALAPRRRRR